MGTVIMLECSFFLFFFFVTIHGLRFFFFLCHDVPSSSVHATIHAHCVSGDDHHMRTSGCSRRAFLHHMFHVCNTGQIYPCINIMQMAGVIVTKRSSSRSNQMVVSSEIKHACMYQQVRSASKLSS